MRKFLVTTLCSMPLIANAINVGGFEFPSNNGNFIVPLGEVTHLMLIMPTGLWTGKYEGGSFQLIDTAKGKNKIWYMISVSKGRDLVVVKNAKSALYLMELDCNEYRRKILQFSAYSGYFAQGSRVKHINNTKAQWDYQPNSSYTMKVGCELIKRDNTN